MKHLLLLFCFSVGLVQASAQDPDGARTLTREGVKLHDAGSFTEAIAKYDAALEKDKDNFLTLAEKCNTLFSLQRYEESVKLSEYTIARHAANDQIGMVYLACGNSLDHLKRPEEALVMYRHGQEADPTEHQMWYNEGVTLAGLERYDEAILSFQKAVTLKPKHASSHNALARMENLKGNRIPALMAFARFLLLEPEGPRAEANLPLMHKVLRGNVEQTGKGNITISVDGSHMPEPGDSTKHLNDFSTAELMLSLMSAADLEKKNKGKGEHELFQANFGLFCGMLEPTDPPQRGFYWSYYAPFFRAMKKDEQLETAVMIMHASSGDKDVEKWVKAHEREVKTFYVWAGNFEWPE